jgi:hypothetical protein
VNTFSSILPSDILWYPRKAVNKIANQSINPDNSCISRLRGFDGFHLLVGSKDTMSCQKPTGHAQPQKNLPTVAPVIKNMPITRKGNCPAANVYWIASNPPKTIPKGDPAGKLTGAGKGIRESPRMIPLSKKKNVI